MIEKRKRINNKQTCRIAQVVMLDWLQVFVEFVDEGNSSRNVELEHVRLGHLVQVLDQGAQTVAVRRNKNTLASLDGRNNFLFPER